MHKSNLCQLKANFWKYPSISDFFPKWTTERGITDYDALLDAIIEVVVNKKKIKTAARLYNIPHTSFDRYIKKFEQKFPDISEMIHDELLKNVKKTYQQWYVELLLLVISWLNMLTSNSVCDEAALVLFCLSSFTLELVLWWRRIFWFRMIFIFFITITSWFIQ